MPSLHNTRTLPYDEAESHIKDADVLLFRGTGLAAKAIQVSGRSVYSHAAMAGWENPGSDYPALMCFEVREWRGGIISPLKWQADKYGGTIDVYRPSRQHWRMEYDPTTHAEIALPHNLEPRKALHVMRQFAHPGEYGWTNIFWTSFLHLPFVRWAVPQPTDDLLERSRPPYCSQAIAYALRQAFTDVVLHTPDCFTHPGDLDKSPLLHYMFTLGPPNTV